MSTQLQSRSRRPRHASRALIISIATLALLALPAAATADVLEQLSPQHKSYLDGADFVEMTGSSSGDVSAAVTAVDLRVPSPAPNSSTSGCAASDFTGFPAGDIALVQRGWCPFAIKAANAESAGAAAVIIFNEGGPSDPFDDRSGYFQGTLGSTPAGVPVVGTTFALGDELRNGVLGGPTGVVARVATDGDSTLDPPATLNRLTSIVENSAMPGDTKDGLNAKLKAMRTSLTSGRTRATCGQLGAFENQVSAETGDAIPESDAQVLVAYAQALRDSLGCV